MLQYESYEQVAQFLINELAQHFGLRNVEGKQTVPGTITDWEIDAKGIRADNSGFIVIECRRYTTSKLKQKDIASLAYEIQDVRGSGGIIVSPLELQKGAKKIAEAANIISVRLNADSTRSDYILQFLNNVMIGVSESFDMKSGIEVAVRVIRICQRCGTSFEVKDNETRCSTCLSLCSDDP
jgi:hypothetical protein